MTTASSSSSSRHQRGQEGRRHRRAGAHRCRLHGRVGSGQDPEGRRAVQLPRRGRRGRPLVRRCLGAFTTVRPGLMRTDTLWKTLGRIHVLRATDEPQNPSRVLVLTSNLPKANSEGDKALRAVGVDQVFDAIEMFDPAGVARLREYARATRSCRSPASGPRPTSPPSRRRSAAPSDRQCRVRRGSHRTAVHLPGRRHRRLASGARPRGRRPNRSGDAGRKRRLDLRRPARGTVGRCRRCVDPGARNRDRCLRRQVDLHRRRPSGRPDRRPTSVHSPVRWWTHRRTRRLG